MRESRGSCLFPDFGWWFCRDGVTWWWPVKWVLACGMLAQQLHLWSLTPTNSSKFTAGSHDTTRADTVVHRCIITDFKLNDLFSEAFGHKVGRSRPLGGWKPHHNRCRRGGGYHGCSPSEMSLHYYSARLSSAKLCATSKWNVYDRPYSTRHVISISVCVVQSKSYVLLKFWFLTFSESEWFQ